MRDALIAIAGTFPAVVVGGLEERDSHTVRVAHHDDIATMLAVAAAIDDAASETAESLDRAVDVVDHEAEMRDTQLIASVRRNTVGSG
jgi:hypothetical protein